MKNKETMEHSDEKDEKHKDEEHDDEKDEEEDEKSKEGLTNNNCKKSNYKFIKTS